MACIILSRVRLCKHCVGDVVYGWAACLRADVCQIKVFPIYFHDISDLFLFIRNLKVTLERRGRNILATIWQVLSLKFWDNPSSCC